MSNNPLLDAALAAAARGWRVFPIDPGGKSPAFRRWQQLATTDHEQVRHWWRPTDRWNVGIATGESGLLVVDLDSADGVAPPDRFKGAQHGSDVLAMLAAAAGAELPTDTYTVSTPRGGRHLYFQAPVGAANRTTAGTLGWRIDTRGRGGAIIGAGSRNGTGTYDLVLDRPVAEMPSWLVKALTPPPPPPPRPPLRLPANRADSYVQAIVANVTAEVTNAQVGQRHYVVLKAARTLGNLVAGGELTEDAATSALLNAAAVHVGVKDWTIEESERTVASGMAFGMRRPRTIGSGPSGATPEGDRRDVER
jgi:hypothetical protein